MRERDQDQDNQYTNQERGFTPEISKHTPPRAEGSMDIFLKIFLIMFCLGCLVLSLPFLFCVFGYLFLMETLGFSESVAQIFFIIAQAIAIIITIKCIYVISKQ